MKNLLVIFSTIGLGFSSLYAGTVDPSLEFAIHQEYTSTRAMAMGNAFTAVVDDHSAIFYNPAVLGMRKEGTFRGFLKFGLSDNYYKLVNDIDKASKKTESESLDDIKTILQKNRGDSFYSKSSLGGAWVRPNWGIAFIPFDLKTDLSIHKQGLEALNVNAYLDTTIAYSYAQKAKKISQYYGDFYWGATAKVIHRIFYSDLLNALSLAEGGEIFDKTRAAEGLTLDLDIGTHWTPKFTKGGIFSFLKPAKPSFAIVGRNLLDYGYLANFHVLDKNSSEPTKLKRRLDFGSKWELPDFWVFDPHLGVDIRDVLHPNWTFKKGLHVGAELFWTMFSWWKGYWSVGMNQGYFTYGLGARLGWFTLDIASWGDEVGSESDPIESRRYMLELSLEF